MCISTAKPPLLACHPQVPQRRLPQKVSDARYTRHLPLLRAGGARGDEGIATLTDLAVEEFLAARLGGGITDLARISHGEWSRAFGFRHAGKEYVARFSAVLEDFAKDRLAAAFASPALPIPPIIDLGEAFGGYYALSERAPGGYLDELDEAGMRRVLPSLFAALDATRDVDLSKTSGYGGWGADGVASHQTWRDYLLDVTRDEPTDRVHGWRERMAASPTGTGPFDTAYAQLQSLLQYVPDERHLIHSDLLNFNVLVADDRLTAVIDWGCSLYGDFLYDLAWFTFWSAWYSAWRGIDFAAEACRHYASIGLAVPSFAQRLRCYELHIALGGMAYAAFKERWEFLEWVARQTMAMASVRA